MRGRRWSTWLVLVALAAIALVAAVDALRDAPERIMTAAEQPRVPGLGDERRVVVRQLREAGVGGVLTYSDQDCRLHAVSLPELEPVRAPSFEMCNPSTSTGELGVLDGDVVWSGLGYGAVQVVLTEEELSRAIFGGETDAGRRFRATQAVVLEGERVLVLAVSTWEPRERVLAAFEGVRPRFVHRSWWVGGAQAVRPSPRGGYYALLGAEPLGGQVFTGEGYPIGIPDGVPDARAVAWSPDERWTALATSESVYVFPSERPRELVIRIPLAVRDLDWSAAEFTSSP